MGFIMRVKIKTIVLPVVCSMLMVVSCSKNQSSTNAVEHPLDMLRQDVGSEPPSLDPQLSEDTYSTRIMFDLFGGLVDFDQQNNVIPGMASSWDISSDGKTYTFHLRDNLKFSDGSPITANDFVYSWQRLVNPKTASPYGFLIRSVVNANQIMNKTVPVTSLGVSAPNQNTFVVKLAHPDGYFLKEIQLSNAYVVPRKAIEKYGTAWIEPSNMINSGAYMLKEHVVNGYVLAVKNPYYYNADQVKIEQVKYLPYEDKNVTIPSYRSGGLDVTFQSVPVDQYVDLKKEFGSQVHKVLLEGNYYIDFNMQEPRIANNIKLRQALSMAVDRQSLVNQVLKMGQQPLYSTVTPTVDNGAFANVKYAWADWPRNKQIEEAKKLFAEAGYGPNNPFVFTYSYNTNDLHKRVALAVLSMWQQVFGNGVKVSLQNQEWKTFLQLRHKGDYDIARDAWSADYNGVTSYTPLYLCKNDQNNSHYCNPEYDRLINQATNTVDAKAQLTLYQQALAIPLNDYAVLPLFQYAYQQMVKPYVKGYNPDQNYLEHVQSKWMSIDK